MEIIWSGIVLLFRLFIVLLAVLFINRYFKFGYGPINHAEETLGRGVDWLRAHHLNIKANLQAAAILLAVAMFVNWHEDIGNEFLTGLGEGLIDFVRREGWNSLIPVIETTTRILTVLIILIAVNRFLKLDVDILSRLDRKLYDFLDSLILAHGGLFELVSKAVMTIILAMTVNHHANIGFPPLSWLENRTAVSLGLEGTWERSAARRERQRCLKDKELSETRAGVLNNAIARAEGEGRTEEVLALRGKLEKLAAEQSEPCE